MWAKLDGRLSDELVSAIRSEAESLALLPGDRHFAFEGKHFFATSRGVALLRRVHLELTRYLRIEDALPDPAIQHAFMLVKAPGGRATRLHQDRPYWTQLEQRASMITVWIALDDVSVENGCLGLPEDDRVQAEALRDFNRAGVCLEHDAFEDRVADVVMAIRPELQQPILERVKSQPMGSGEMLVFDAFEPHCSTANSTARPRFAMKIVYGDRIGLRASMLSVADLVAGRYAKFLLNQKLRQVVKRVPLRKVGKQVLGSVGYR